MSGGRAAGNPAAAAALVRARQSAPRREEPPLSGPRYQKDMAGEIIRAMISTGFLAPGDFVPTAAELAAAIPHVSKASWEQGKFHLLGIGVLTRPGLGGRMRVPEGGEESGSRATPPPSPLSPVRPGPDASALASATPT